MSSMSTENSLRETTTREMGREIQQRNIARALARDARYVRARKAFSVLMRTAGDGSRWSHKSQNEAIRTCPAANMLGRARPSVKPPSTVSAPDTYIYPHNKLPYVQSVMTLPRLCILMRDIGDGDETLALWLNWTMFPRTFRIDRRLMASSNLKR